MFKDENISFLQIFGIFLVVLGHTELNQFLKTWIYSFHMPLFMAISGYLFYVTQKKYKGNRENFLDFINKKIKRLLIPYFIISSLAYIPKYLLNKFAVRPVELTFKSYILSFIYPWDNAIIFFWFLPTLFFILTIIFLLYKILKLSTNALFITFLVIGIISKYFISISFLNISGILNYTIFFILGIKLAENRDRIREKIKEREKVLCFSLFLLLTFGVGGYYKFNYFTSSFGYYLLSFIGIGMSWVLSYIYINYKFNFLNKFYGMSYSIYLFSWFPQVFVRILCFQVMKIEPILGNIISFILGVYVPIMINKIVKRFVTNKNNIIRIISGI